MQGTQWLPVVALQVLQLYRTILKTGLDWKQVELDRSGSDPEVRKKVLQERQYIKWEAKRLFKRNKNITDLERVEKKIFEATTRLDMAVCGLRT